MNDIKEKYSIIVARYNENINWLLSYKDICYIYNKGKQDIPGHLFHIINLPNYGRESHTYLYHIIQNYDHLTEYNIFFQGKIQDHMILNIEDYFEEKDFVAFTKKEDIQKFKKPIAHFGKWKNDLIQGKMSPSPFILYDWITKLCGIKLDESLRYIPVAWGAIFSVSRKLIHQKPKEFYEYLYRYLNYYDNPEEGHFFERSWYTFFHYPILPKKYIYVIPLNNTTYSSFSMKKIENIISQIIKKNAHENQIAEIHYWNPYKIQSIYHPEKLNHISSNKFIALQNIFQSIFHLELELKDIFSIKLNINDDSLYEFIFDIQKGFTIFMNYTMIFQKHNDHLSGKHSKNIQFTIHNDHSKDKNITILLDNQEVFSFTNPNIHFDQVFIRSSMNHQVFQIKNNIDNKKNNNNDDNNKNNNNEDDNYNNEDDNYNNEDDNYNNEDDNYNKEVIDNYKKEVIDNYKKEDIDNEDDSNKEDINLNKISEKYFMYDTQKQEIDIYYKYNYLDHYVKNIEIQDYLEYFI